MTGYMSTAVAANIAWIQVMLFGIRISGASTAGNKKVMRASAIAVALFFCSHPCMRKYPRLGDVAAAAEKVGGRRVKIPGGIRGVVATLDMMAEIARRAAKEPVIRSAAVQAVQGAGSKDWAGEVVAIHALVRQVRYVRDVAGVETLQDPRYTLREAHGDCDDQAMLVASLLLAIDHRVRFVAVGPAPGAYSHVYCETWLTDRWTPVETTLECAVGWSPPAVKARIEKLI